MAQDKLIPEDLIRERSYTLWESDGRQDGRSMEYWLRALAQLRTEMERSLQVALDECENTALAMPKPEISTPPKRQEAGRIAPAPFQEAA